MKPKNQKPHYQQNNSLSVLKWTNNILTILIVVLLVYGVNRYFEQNETKTQKGQKIIYSIKNLEQTQEDAENSESRTLGPSADGEGLSAKISIAVIMEPQTQESYDYVINNFKQKVTFAHNPNYGIALNDGRSWPALKYFSTTEQGVNDLERISPENNNFIGVYNISPWESFTDDLALTKKLITWLKEKNMVLLYGVNNLTTSIESSDENNFYVDAADIVIKLETDSQEEINSKLKSFCKIAKQKNRGVLFVEAVEINENLKFLQNWLSEAATKDIKISSFASLPKIIEVK